MLKKALERASGATAYNLDKTEGRLVPDIMLN